MDLIETLLAESPRSRFSIEDASGNVFGSTNSLEQAEEFAWMTNDEQYTSPKDLLVIDNEQPDNTLKCVYRISADGEVWRTSHPVDNPEPGEDEEDYSAWDYVDKHEDELFSWRKDHTTQGMQ